MEKTYKKEVTHEGVTFIRSFSEAEWERREFTDPVFFLHGAKCDDFEYLFTTAQRAFHALLRKYLKVSEGDALAVIRRERAVLLLVGERGGLTSLCQDIRQAQEPSDLVVAAFSLVRALGDVLPHKMSTRKVRIEKNIGDITIRNPAWQYRHLSQLENFAKRRLSSYIHSFVLHGSFATGDFVDGWSDLDSVVIARDEVILLPEKLRAFKRELSRAALVCYQIDPLAHHEIPVITEYDVGHYSEAILPLALFENGALLSGESAITFSTRQDTRGSIFSLIDFCSSFRRAVQEKKYSATQVSWKQDLAHALLLPAFALAARGQYVYKRESFELSKKTFPGIDWGPVGQASQLRQTMRAFSMVRHVPTSLVFLGSPVVTRRIVTRFLTSVRGSAPQTSSIEIKTLTGQFLELTESIIKDVVV
jgi:predicted nucleotidyltransferase